MIKRSINGGFSLRSAKERFQEWQELKEAKFRLDVSFELKTASASGISGGFYLERGVAKLEDGFYLECRVKTAMLSWQVKSDSIKIRKPKRYQVFNAFSVKDTQFSAIIYKRVDI